MLTPVLLLAVVINIVGVLNNYNIDKHPLDIRVRRDARGGLRDGASARLLNQTNDISNRNTTADTAGGEETTKEHEANIDVAYTTEDDLLLNYTGYNETETNELIEDEDNLPEEKIFADIVTEVFDSGLIKSDSSIIKLQNQTMKPSSDNKATENKESSDNKTTEIYQEETDTGLMDSVSENSDNDLPEIAANGVKALLINKIIKGLFNVEFDRDDNKTKFDAKHDTEVIKELDDQLTKLKSDDDNKTQEEFTNYDNEIFDYKHANILLDIILNLRNNNVNEIEKIQRAKRYAPYGDRTFNASPNNTRSGAGPVGYGTNPGYVVNNTGHRAMVPDFNYINKQYTQPYPNNVNLYPSNNFYRQNTNYPHYNYNNTHYYNQLTNNLRNRTNYPTYPINPNPINYNQNYRNYNPNARQNNQPYYYNNSPGYNPGYNPISPYRGNQTAPSHDTSGSGTNADNLNNYYPMSNSSGNRLDGHQHAAPAPNGNATVTANTTAAPVILESCFLCGSVGCPKFFRKMGFLCVPLDED